MRYEINKTFETQEEAMNYEKQITVKHPDGYRTLYNGEVVDAVEYHTSVAYRNGKWVEGPVTLQTIVTWGRKCQS